MKLCLSVFDSPLGQLLIVADGPQLVALDFADCEGRMHRLLKKRYAAPSVSSGPVSASVRSRLSDYFEGDLRAVSEIPFETGGTAFQRKVWAALTETVPAQTYTYAEIAKKIALPNGCRAVGLANGSNPIAIVIPCHRIIGKSGKLTGYAGGLDRKRWLLDHEKKHEAPAKRRSTHASTRVA